MHDEAAATLVVEFLERKWLNGLGYTFSGDDLDVLTAEAFVTIGAELQAIGRKKGGRQANDRT